MRRRWIIAGVLGLVLPTVYLASYPVAHKLTAGRIEGAWYYSPAELIIDSTPLTRPMMWWGDQFGVGDEMRLESLTRQITGFIEDSFST